MLAANGVLVLIELIESGLNNSKSTAGKMLVAYSCSKGLEVIPLLKLLNKEPNLLESIY